MDVVGADAAVFAADFGRSDCLLYQVGLLEQIFVVFQKDLYGGEK